MWAGDFPETGLQHSRKDFVKRGWFWHKAPEGTHNLKTIDAFKPEYHSQIQGYLDTFEQIKIANAQK